MRQRGSSVVGLIIGVFFLVGGLGLRQLGNSGWPLGELGQELDIDPAGDVLGMIGMIWAGVGGLLVLLFLVLTITGGGSQGVAVQEPYTVTPPSAGNHVAAGLTQLAALKDRGLLSDQEWTQAKAMFLGKTEDHRLMDARILEELHDLYEAGGLSESEYNTKKWEILARS